MFLMPNGRRKAFSKPRRATSSTMKGYVIGRQNGWLSANDIRTLDRLNPIPEEDGGDRYLVNGNMVDLKHAGHFVKDGDKE